VIPWDGAYRTEPPSVQPPPPPVMHRVYRQDHRGAGVLQSEHADLDEALAVARDGRRTTRAGRLSANLWYVASPKGTTGMWEVTFV
jgi:hypothetical protein